MDKIKVKVKIIHMDMIKDKVKARITMAKMWDTNTKER